MQIAFRKITKSPKSFELVQDGLKLSCTLARVNDKIARLEGKIHGKIELICDISGDEFLKSVDENLTLHISDGICNVQSQSENFDIIEIFDGQIDLNYIFSSEIELIKSDYHSKE